jgi:nucleoside-diphosphate-sugar epimerase
MWSLKYIVGGRDLSHIRELIMISNKSMRHPVAAAVNCEIILLHRYGVDNPEIQFRIVRFHNIYGPHGTWKGGREKAPAAFLRKVRTHT